MKSTRISISIVLFVLAILLSKSTGFYLDLLTYNLEPSSNETEARLFLSNYDKEVQSLTTESTIAEWKYYTNLTDDNEKTNSAASLKLAEFNTIAYLTASKFDTTNFSDDTKRQLKKVGKEALPEEEEKEFNKIMTEMGGIYGTSEVCLNGTKWSNLSDNGNKCLPLEPGLTEIMADSNDYELRSYVWKEWRKQAGRKIKPKYERYVELLNKRSRLNGFDDAGDDWRSLYEVDNFEEKVLQIYKELEPLYKELHAYIRRKLYEKYGEDVIDLKGKLPACVLSDMWGRFWNNLYKDVVPYPDRPSLDVSDAMKEQGYDVKKMFQSADDFYAGMGLERVNDLFWKNSMLEKPKDGRKVVCHATAWDFFDAKDFRIKMCTRSYNQEDLTTIYHEMGHIQYYMQYSHQPIVYREGANNGFHEAIGELMALAGATPKYLNSIGLIPDDEFKEEDPETDVNFLMSQALITVSTLPFHLVNDLWRWKIFRKEVPKDEWNTLFWKLKNEYVGVEAPVERTKEDLDPPTIFHISGGYTMMRYFTRTIFQFQFLEGLCNIADPGTPLHRCDISGSEEAGKALAEMLKLGSSLPWPDALEKLTGTREISVQPIISFFKPLHNWLTENNKLNDEKIGWN